MLLIEEILHHLERIKPCNLRDKHGQSTYLLVQDFFHHQHWCQICQFQENSLPWRIKMLNSYLHNGHGNSRHMQSTTHELGSSNSMQTKTPTTIGTSKAHLVGGFNPSEKYSSNWMVSPGRGEHKKYLEPPPSSAFFIFGIGEYFGTVPELL